jgi:hypothetical protein
MKVVLVEAIQTKGPLAQEKRKGISSVDEFKRIRRRWSV